ncbi:peroxidase family protein [Marmoricola sp. RAF53]|uniref:peroxidase family protein n=1 Tax=Marmoricola sp. RAF53 TaxID=3233059 RepID=UPI003F9B3EF1
MTVALVAVGLSFLTPLAPARGAVAPVGNGFTVTPGDLSFILKQIKIAERHSATLTPANPCGTLVGTAANQIPDRLSSFGLRTVDGSCNNLFDGRTKFGSADQPFPRLTTPVFRDAEAAPAGFPPPPSGPGTNSTYKQKKGFVYDSKPRTVSNLIVDQTSTNPAAIAAAGFPVRSQGNPGQFPCTVDPDPTAQPPVEGSPAGCVPSHQTLFIPNVTTDVGLSPPYNSLFTFFGQFFDHGVDQTVKSGGTVFVPLKADDPLRTVGPDGKAGTGDEVPASQAFMVLTRAQNQPGPDGVLGDNPATPADESADDVQDANNTDSPWVDQSQTYTSHASHQVFVREYSLNGAGRPVASGKLLGGLPAGQTYSGSPDGTTGMATWASVKKQAAEKLGLRLVDRDVTNIPMLATDPYGEFIPGPARGLPQYVTKTGLVEGNIAAPVAVPANVVYFDTPFLTDIAHNADPSPADSDNNPATPPVVPTPDANNTPSADFAHQPLNTYDDEMLNAHFIAGDGRVNENIALTTIHQIFHSEHDRLVDDITNTLNDPANAALKAAYQDRTNTGAFTFGDRLFQAARFVTEMEYQHLVFEEFARKMVPAIRPFHVYVPDPNPAVQAEFAHAVYRFGHSMLDDDVARTNINGSDNSIPLLTAFLNPPEYQNGGSVGTLTPEQAAGSVVMGSADQVGNELDEFVVETLRNNLLGLPLDLPTLNMARARDAGIPPLNEVRRQIHASTNDAAMAPYTSWTDYGQHLKHPESLINFVAAYGTHPTITSATTLAAKRAAAKAIVDPSSAPATDPANIPADAAAFMFGTDGRTMAGCDAPGADCRDWSDVNGKPSTGLEEVDLWVGGLAEVTNLFGGLLGSTFNYVFQKQLEDLQEGDRLYYLNRTPGMNLRTQLEGNSFSEMIQRNTDGTNTLKADAFATADCKFQLANLAGTAAGFQQFGSTVADDPSTPDCNETLLLLRQPDGTIAYKTRNTVDPTGINGQSVYNGTPGTDRVNGGNDNDTFWGGDSVDFLEGNGGDDVALGGNGNDILTDLDGADVLKGGPGNDAIDTGPGDDISMGGDGQDFMNGGANDNEAFAGPGNDFMIAGQGADAVFGDGGDDWIQGGLGQDLLIGDHGAPFFDDPAEDKPGNDVFVGQPGENDYDAEGGDDLMSQNPAIDRNAGAGGFDWAYHQYDTTGADDDMAINNNLLGNPLPVVVNRDRWQETEGDSGSAFNDVIRGDDAVPRTVGGGGFTGCDALDQTGVNRINGLAALLPPLTGTAADVAAASATGTCPLSGPVWGDGNILLGGAGSDTITGRGADDIIDGDKFLATRISLRTDPADPTTEIGSTDLMEHTALTGTFGPNTAGETLQKAVFDGDVDAGKLVIVREILSPPASDSTSVDTAAFSGPRANYTISFLAGGVVTVTDNVGTDGTDRITKVEKLQFTDQTLDIATAPNAPVIGTAVAGNASATVNWTLGAANASSPINQFQIEVLVGGVVQRTVTGIAANQRSAVVNGLTNGTTYTFRVIAVNQVGISSPPSAQSNAVTPNNPAPEVISSTPANGATGVSLTNDLTVTFDEPVTGISGTSVILRNPAGATVASALTFNNATRTLTINPNANLAAGTTYTLTLLGTLPNGTAGIRNAANLRLANTTITFTTLADTTAPTITSINPANGSTGVARNTTVVITFSEPVQAASTNNVQLRFPGLLGIPTLVAGTVTLNAAGTQATFRPTLNLGANVLYTLTVTGGTNQIRDLANNPLSPTTTTSTFRTR